MHGGEKTWAVYLLPGTTDAAVIPAGGAFRIDVSFDGAKIIGTAVHQGLHAETATP